MRKRNMVAIDPWAERLARVCATAYGTRASEAYLLATEMRRRGEPDAAIEQSVRLACEWAQMKGVPVREAVKQILDRFDELERKLT